MLGAGFRDLKESSTKASWWEEFFDQDYLRLWTHLYPEAQCDSDAESLRTILNIKEGDNLLDAACGYGRMSLPFAKLGLQVLGVDYSNDLLQRAKSDLEAHQGLSLLYQQGDLRDCELPPHFDAAVSLFSSVGYASENDDLLILNNIARSLVPGGRFFIETIHRDAIVFRRALGQTTGIRGPDGLTLREKNRFDPVTGHIHSTWTWNSLKEAGSKRSIIRIYSASELVSLLSRAGFSDIRCFAGFSQQPFDESTIGQRLGILCSKSTTS